ncbi:anti-sigma B factor antagonist [Lonsdalea britannica]|uniref:STAS domain-containing protein n=1 Tax=Lonsdalea britannica TaxID=1082704 RepID=A0AAD0SFA7_9GAMM|nr:lipid asymmetry maintenance protein MlaB [Lonsdalea britannica]AXW86698.1 STAS domain-containing protein [Lonsdalea britannica]OSM97588.1 anti-sigma B factor antagonist [Lonsdalea britannica]
MAEPLSWQSQEGTLTLKGDLDRETLLPLWQQHETLLAESVELDVSQLQRVDSAGLALLVHFYHEQTQKGRDLRIIGVSDRLRTLIDLYNLNNVIPVQLTR